MLRKLPSVILLVQSFKSKKILGTKAGTYESLKSQPLVSVCFISGIKSKLAERVSDGSCERFATIENF